MTPQRFGCLPADAQRRSAKVTADQRHEMMGQRHNILHSLSKRRHRQRKYAEPIIQVFAKPAFAHFRFQVSIRRGNDAHVGVKSLVVANPLELAFLQSTQQLTLQA